jgi:hypothetical protein
MDELLDPKDDEIKKAKKIHDEDEAEFPEEDNLDDDFLSDGKTKKKQLGEDTESLDDLAEEEDTLLDEDSFDDVDPW